MMADDKYEEYGEDVAGKGGEANKDDDKIDNDDGSVKPNVVKGEVMVKVFTGDGDEGKAEEGKDGKGED